MMKYSIAEFRKNTRGILNAVDQGAEIYIERYNMLYRIEKGTVSADTLPPNLMKKELGVDPFKDFAAAKPMKVLHAKLDARVPKGVEPVNACPHGFAKGLCKKADCNRRYQK